MNDDEQIYWLAVIGSLCVTVPYVGMTTAAIEYFLRMRDYKNLLVFGGLPLLFSPLYANVIMGLRDVAKWKEDGFT